MNKPTQTRYDFIAIHIDNFIVVAKDTTLHTKDFSKFFSLKSEGLPEYFLENNYYKKENGLSII